MRRAGLAAWLLLLPSLAAAGVVPSPRPNPFGTPTPTRTPALPPPEATVAPDVAGFGQRVELRAILSAPAAVRWQQESGDVAIDIDDADAAVTSFLVPRVDAPTTVRIRLSLTTHATASGLWDVTLLPPDTIALDAIGGWGPPGETAPVFVRLRSVGRSVARLEHGLRFGEVAPVRARPDGSPDCAAASGLAVDEASFEFAPPGCTGTACTLVKAFIVPSAPPPDNSEIYTCQVDLPAVDVGTCLHQIGCGGGQAYDTGEVPLLVKCDDSAVSADYAAARRPIAVSVDPADPEVGDSVRITATSLAGGLTVYSLFGADDLLRGERTLRGHGTGTAVFEMTAMRSGRGDIQVGRHDEITGGCPSHTYYAFQSDASPPIPLTIGGEPPCPSDCNGDRTTAINEVIIIVSIALGMQPLDICPLADASGDGVVRIDDAVRAVLMAHSPC